MRVFTKRRSVMMVVLVAVGAGVGLVGTHSAKAAVVEARKRGADAREARELVTQAPAWELAAGARRARLEAIAPLLLEAATESEAATGLSALLRTWSGLHGARVVSTELLPGDAAAHLGTTRVHLRLSGPVEAIVGVLEKVEYGPRLLSVEAFSVRNEGDGVIACELTVIGWYATGGRA